MDDRRCPLCGGILLEKICIDCGFEALTEEEIAAPYDFVPENDKFGDAESVSDAAEMEGISVSSIETEPDTVSVTPVINQSVHKKTTHQPYTFNQYNTSTNLPVQNQSVVEMIVQDTVATIKKHWWKMLLTLLFPMSGFFIGLAYCMLGSGGGRRKDASDLNFGLIFKGVCYMSAAGLLNKFGIGFSIL